MTTCGTVESGAVVLKREGPPGMAILAGAVEAPRSFAATCKKDSPPAAHDLQKNQESIMRSEDTIVSRFE